MFRSMSWVHTRRLFALGVLLPLLHLANVASGAELKKVNEVLATEAAGKPINRREALAKESDQISQWQAGRILIDGQWLDIESLQTHKLAAQATAYRQQRDSQELDIEGHRRMARWCQAHQLPDMADVHWKAVVTVAVDDEQAHKALGHKKVGNDWFTNEELEQAANEQKHEKVALRQWMPIMRKLAIKLGSHDTQSQLRAMKDLEKIDSSDAIPALKYAALQVEPSVALPIVSKIKSIRSKDSCLALCEIAICDPTSDVGRLAIEGLKEYDEHFYVPELLQMLQMPVTIKQKFVYLPNGSLAVQRAYERETFDSKEYVEILKLITLTGSQNLNYTNAVPTSSSTTTAQPIDSNHWRLNTTTKTTFNNPLTIFALHPQAVQSAEKLSAIAVRKEDQATKLMNELQSQRERNAKIILSAISGLPVSDSAEDYWNWWPSFNESETNVKATSRRYVVDDTQPINLTTSVTVPSNSQAVSISSRVEAHGNCLVAGTLVQTSDGLKTIETVKVGDLITSMNIQTGEISLRPATHVTVREAKTTFQISLQNEETIQVTGGHNWWVVGRGWVRSRDLVADQFMRTGASSIQISSVKKLDAPINVYNMIVDENHTYFVGKDRLLSWDVTSLKPTLQTAPGQATLVSTK